MVSDLCANRIRQKPAGPAVLPALVLAAAVSVLSGCEDQEDRVPTHPVKGTLTFRGKPAPGAYLVFHPKNAGDKTVPKPTASVDADGNFALSTYGGNDGAPEGEYTVVIRWHKLIERDGDATAGPNVLPQKYSNPAESKLLIRVAAGNNELDPLKLK